MVRFSLTSGNANIFKKFYFKLATDQVKKLPIVPNNLCTNSAKYYIFIIKIESNFRY